MGEGIKGGNLGGVRGVFQNAGDAVDVGTGDLGNVVRPIFPVVAVADLLHHEVDGFLLDLADLELQLALVFLAWLFGRFADGVLTASSILVLLALGLSCFFWILSVMAMTSILLVSLPIRSSLSTIASKRSCERKACSTRQTTA